MAEQLVIDSFNKIGSGRALYDVKTNQGDFYYFPSEYVTKGVKYNKYIYYDPQLLENDVLKAGTGINLDPSVYKGTLLEDLYENPGSGVLLPKDAYDMNKGAQYYDPKRGAIAGMTTIDGQNVYLLEGYTDRNQEYFTAEKNEKGNYTGGAIVRTVTPGKSKFGILGKIASSIAKTFAGIPLLPEIAAAVIPGAGPALYGSLKSLQTAGKGGDLGDVVKSGVLSAGAMGVAQGLLATPTGTPQPGVDYSLTGGGVDVGGLGFKADPGMLSPELGASIGAGGVVAPGVGLVIDPGMLAPALGTNLGVVVPPTDYSLLGGADLTGVGETGLIPGSTVGLQAPTLPSVSSMGGGQGLSVPVEGGTVTQGGFTPTGAVPVLGDPGSFINDPNVLGQPVISAEPASIISLSDAFRAARTINNLMGAGGEQPGAPQRQELGQMQPTGVDTLRLPQFSAGVPNIAGLLNPMPYRGPYFDVYTGLPSLLG
jgi:hypothetical protein